MEAKHTPGPWVSEKIGERDDGRGLFNVRDNEGCLVAEMMYEDDARLIAAFVREVREASVEWNAGPFSVRACPQCFGRKSAGHMPDCRLAGLLARIPKEAP